MIIKVFRSALAVLLLLPALAAAEVDKSRFPPWLPGWIWDNDATSHLMTPRFVLELRRDIEWFPVLSKIDADGAEADALEDSISGRLSRSFAPRDLVGGSLRIGDRKSGIDLAIRIDPAFSPEVRALIEDAARRFVSVALDRRVIALSIGRTVSRPSPFPEPYELKDGEEVTDLAGRKKLTSDFGLHLRQRPPPPSAAEFAARLKSALESRNGEPSLLVITSYKGDAWWGRGYYRHFDLTTQQLSRESPSRGYLYIALNTDKLTPGVDNWKDADFWASKLGHEILHNLGYWHPPYKDPPHRDEHVTAGSWPLPVSYEYALLDRLKSR